MSSVSFRLQPTGSEFCLISSRQMSRWWRLGAFNSPSRRQGSCYICCCHTQRADGEQSEGCRTTENLSHITPSGGAKAPQWGIFHSSQSVSTHTHILTQCIYYIFSLMVRKRVSLGRQHRTRINAAKIFLLVKQLLVSRVYFFPLHRTFCSNSIPEYRSKWLEQRKYNFTHNCSEFIF